MHNAIVTYKLFFCRAIHHAYINHKKLKIINRTTTLKTTGPENVALRTPPATANAYHVFFVSTASAYIDAISNLWKTNIIDKITAIQNALASALDILPQRQKQVFEMRYYEELSYENIAQILGVSVGALKASYHHAVKKLEENILETLNPISN